MQALALVASLESAGRAATPEEQRQLASWSGWGALPLMFEPKPADYEPGAPRETRSAAIRWQALDPARQQLRELLSDDEWADARRNTLNAHYTDPALVTAVWEGIRRLDFDGGHVLEPSSGSGIYIGLAPTDTTIPVEMTAVEVEAKTAGISRQLYPDATVINAGFETVAFSDPFDAVVGNVPFGRYQRYDKVHNADLKLSIHDHFVLKSLALTRPGGIVALITSRFTLDSKDPSARERMYDLGDLVGAVRLPAGAHREAAGTDVVTDLLLLRRRIDGETPGDDQWLTASEQVLPGRDEPVVINDYITGHPEYVLGELRTRLGQFGAEPTVAGDRDAAAGLSKAVAAIAAAARSSGLTVTPSGESGMTSTSARPAVVVEHLTEGALGLDGAGRPTIVEDGRTVLLEVHPEHRERLVQLIDLKKRTLALYKAEAEAVELGETPQLAAMRTALRDAYRVYRRTNPPPGKPKQRFVFTPKEAKERADRQGLTSVPDEWKARTAFSYIDDDPDASLLFGLEVWDERTGTATEQKVLHDRVLEPRRIPETAKTPEDAVALALEWDGGRLDMSRVASLLGVEEDEAAHQVGHLAFRDPAQNGFWEPRHRYLSGNVREKLAVARASAADDPAYVTNVSALERVQPTDLNPSEIKARCGAPWIPVDDYQAFLNHLGFEKAEVRHAGGTMWEVRGAHVGDLARSEWGTPDRSAQDLMLSILRQADSTIQVTYRDNEGNTQVNQPATDAAREKARLIREAWDDWIWADKERSERLSGIYNTIFNALVLPEYDSSPLTLPGVGDWTMRPHQNAAIRRIVSEPTALLAHVVGAGKTATMVGGIMELRRTGLARKPAMVIPNHMLRQIAREFREVYPNAKLLTISASDLGVKRRAKFMARAAGGDWDAVIMTHEAFNRVPLLPKTQLDYIDTEVASLREQLDEAGAAGMHERTIKQIETDLAAVEARMLKQVEESTTGSGIFLEDTGIDYLMVDEAHAYKNLRTISAIPGAGIQGSVKATKLHMVLGHLRKTNGSGRVCTLATGTPIANSVTEAYVLKRYLAPDLLDRQGLTNFDSWAATFGEVVSSLEPDAKGDGYKYKARFARFFNVPELMASYRSFADVQNTEDLGLPVPTVLKGPDGQRGESIAFPVTGIQRAYIKDLPKKPWVSRPGGVLKALGLGLRASLDMRLVGEQDEEAGSKLPYAAEKIAEIWQDTKDIVYPTSKDDPTPQKFPGGLQLVFLDEGTPGSAAENPVDLYDSLREHLVEQGVPREEIRFIHEASTDRKKDRLFADCRAGRVSVLVGSTEKMGTGTNIQDRAVALHHLSYPWRPADMAQRDGRLERQGNLNAPWIEGTPDHVRILYYVTAGSFDEFRLTTLARKAKFIAQIQRKDFSLREIEDIGEEAINLSMLSALASGDPAILQLAEATADRARMQGLARAWDGQQDDRAQTVKYLDDYLQRARASLAGMREAAPLRRPTAGDAFAITIDGRTLRGRDTAAKTLGARMVAIARDPSLRPGDRVPIGDLGGIPFHGEISYDYSGHRQLKLRFAWGHTVPVGHRDDRAQWKATSVTESNGRGAIVGLENFLNKLDDDAAKLEREITTQLGHRQDAATNLRPYEDNPYRIQARSKEREERFLSQLVIINEKKATLADTVATAGESAHQRDVEELEELTEKAAELRTHITDEHAIQEQATNPNVDQEPRTARSAESDTSAPADTTEGTTATATSASSPEPEKPSAPQAKQPDDYTQGTPPAPGRPPEEDHRADTIHTTGHDEPQERDRAQPVPAPAAETDMPGREMTVQEMALHDAQAMAHLLGGTAQAADETMLDELLSSWSATPQKTELTLSDPELRQAAIIAITAAADADEPLTNQARYLGQAPFTEALHAWAETWFTEHWMTAPLDDLPDWATAYALPAEEATQGEILDQVAADLSARASRQEPSSGDNTADKESAPPPEPHMAGLPSAASGEAEDTATDPEVEAIRQMWLQSKDWRVKSVAEGRSGQRIHLSETPGYVLVERTSRKAAHRWEVVPASTGLRIKIGEYSRIASWDTEGREPAEAFASKLEEALRGKSATPFVWPPSRKWRSAEGHRLDRVIADIRAACDRDRGIEDSPGIHQAMILAERDTQAEAAAEEKKAAAETERHAAKAAKKARAAADRTPTADADSSTSDDSSRLSDDHRDVAEEQQEAAPSTTADTEPAVITPEGPGRLIGLQGGLALVAGEAGGTKIWHRTEIYHPGQPDAPLTDPAELERRRQNESDAAKASTPAGIHLRYPYSRRLRDLDTEAGHGTVVEHAVVDQDGNVHEPGEVVGWVRARIGDDGKRYWWGQDADGGPPDKMPFHEDLPAKAGLPAIRAAGRVRHNMPGNNFVRRPITAPYATREIKLTTAQVAQLRTLPLTGTYPDGSELPTPPWVSNHRRYMMSVAQMQALRGAAEAAADTCDLTTVSGRRTRTVLLNAANKLHFEEYETGRRGATIPPIGDPDPYAGPYAPPPPRPAPAPAQEEELSPSPESAEEAGHDQDQTAPESTHHPAEPAPVRAPEADRPTGEPGIEEPFPPQTRVFHDAMRYVVESVSPDGTAIRTVSGHTLPVSDLVAEADMSPVTTEDLAEGWWRYSFEGRSYTAALLPPDLLRAHPRATLSVVIVDQDNHLVGRAFGRPHESAIIWAASHPAAPHPHVADWLGSTPWPEYTDAEQAFVAGGPPNQTEPAERPNDPPVAQEQPQRPTPDAGPTPDEPKADAASATVHDPQKGSVSTTDPEEYDMTATTEPPDTIPDIDAPDIEDPPEAKRYTETTSLADPEYVLRLYGWDGQPADSGDLYHRDTPVAALRPSADGGWVARLTAHGGDVTPLSARPDEAAHHAAIYFSALTTTPYGAPVPPPQPDETLTRADKVRIAVRNAAGTHHDRITTASAQAWPETYGTHPQLQRLLDRLDDMQNAVADTAGARQMEADLNAALQAARELGAALPDAPTDRMRQHMGFPLGYLLYDVRRLQDYLQAAVDATIAERTAAQQTQNTDHSQPDRARTEGPVVPLTTSGPPTDPEPERAAPPEPRSSTPAEEPEQSASAPVRLPPAAGTFPDEDQPGEPLTERPERGEAVAIESAAAEPASDPDTWERVDVEQDPPLHDIALPHDPTYRLHLTGATEPGHAGGEVRSGDSRIADIVTTANGRLYGRLSDGSGPPYSTPPSDTPLKVAHQVAILNSAVTGRPYGSPPTAAQETSTSTRIEVLREEMRTLATAHRAAVDAAVQQAWPDGCDQPGLLDRLNDQLGMLNAAVDREPTANQMHDQLSDMQWLANHWLGRIQKRDMEHVRRSMGYPLAAVVYDMDRLAQRLDVTAEAVRAERAAAERPTVATEPAAASEQEGAVPQAPTSRAAELTDDRQKTEPVPASVRDQGQETPDAGLPPVTDQENRPEADADAAPAHTTATTPPTTELPVEGPNDLPSILAAPDLPLWNGPDPATGERPERSDDTEILDNIGAIQEAWEAVRAEGRTGTAHDLVAALDVELTALRRALDGPNADSGTTTGSPASQHELGTHRDADAVNTALTNVDQHPVLRKSPEWQDIQTVRGATRNLWLAIKRQTGAYFEQLLDNDRFQGWWKKTSIRVCERISELALRTADRLRADAPEPAAVMDHLHHAASAYSRPEPTPPTAAQPDIQLRKLGEGLAAAQVKVNAARARSTTVRKPPGPRRGTADRPEHLRRTPADPKQGPRPGR